MFKAKGSFKVLLNNKEYGNLLLSNYYLKTSYEQNMACKVGSGITPPQLTDNALESELATSATSQLGSVALRLEQTVAKLSRSATFTFPVFSGVVTELGVVNSSLVSRALAESLNGDVDQIPVTTDDLLQIKYTLTHEVPRQLLPVQLIVGGVSVDATLQFVNYQKLTTLALGQLLDSASMSIQETVTFVPDSNGVVTSGVVGDNVTCSLGLNGGGAAHDTLISGLFGVSDAVGDIAQICLYVGTASANNLIAIITPTTAVSKSATDIVQFTIALRQVA